MPYEMRISDCSSDLFSSDLAMGGHLMLVSFVVQSYQALPPGGAMLSNDAVWHLIEFGGAMLGAGVTIALPVGFAMVLVQIVMGMLARTAPALNLFSVGMPVALMAGLILLAVTAPLMGEGITPAQIGRAAGRERVCE